MDLAVARVGGSTVGRLSYGQSVRLVTEEARHFHVNTPLAGRALSTAGASELLGTGPGQAAVFPPGAPADIRWSEDCVQRPQGAATRDTRQHHGRGGRLPLGAGAHEPFRGRIPLRVRRVTIADAAPVWFWSWLAIAF